MNSTARPSPCRLCFRHCEPTGRANARPMTGSAKQSNGRFDCGAHGLLRRLRSSQRPWCDSWPRDSASTAAPLPAAARPTETAIEPAPFLQRLRDQWGCDFIRLAPPARKEICARCATPCRERTMRFLSSYLGTTSLVLLAFATAPLKAADLDAASAIDTVTVYPDGASVTRVITLDLPSGDNTLVARDFPLTLDPSSLRVEGEAGTKLMIGAIDARPPRQVTPVNLPEIDKRIEALKDQRADLDGTISAAEARRKFAERFAEASPAGLGEKGEARPLDEWRAAFAAVSDEVAKADTAIRDAQRKQRDIDREIARLEQDRNTKPPSKLEVRIDLAALASTKATLRVTYSVKKARWTPLYDARLDTGTRDRKPSIELVRRAEITQSTGEDWSNVTLGVSTVRTARGGAAPDLNSLIVQYPQVPRPQMLGGVADARRSMALAPAPASEAVDNLAKKEKSDEQQAVAEVGTFQASFRIPGRVSVGANEGAKSLRIASATITPDLVIRSAPVIDPTAFLEASFL